MAYDTEEYYQDEDDAYAFEEHDEPSALGTKVRSVNQRKGKRDTLQSNPFLAEKVSNSRYRGIA